MQAVEESPDKAAACMSLTLSFLNGDTHLIDVDSQSSVATLIASVYEVLNLSSQDQLAVTFGTELLQAEQKESLKTIGISDGEELSVMILENEARFVGIWVNTRDPDCEHYTIEKTKLWKDEMEMAIEILSPTEFYVPVWHEFATLDGDDTIIWTRPDSSINFHPWARKQAVTTPARQSLIRIEEGIWKSRQCQYSGEWKQGVFHWSTGHTTDVEVITPLKFRVPDGTTGVLIGDEVCWRDGNVWTWKAENYGKARTAARRLSTETFHDSDIRALYLASAFLYRPLAYWPVLRRRTDDDFDAFDHVQPRRMQVEVTLDRGANEVTNIRDVVSNPFCPQPRSKRKQARAFRRSFAAGNRRVNHKQVSYNRPRRATPRNR